jgi:peptidase M28-like protein
MQKLVFLALVASFSLNFARSPAPPAPPLPSAVQHALSSVSADELKGDLSFLASDALQGRFTPSPGLDVAAEFIASKFRSAGLEPGGDHDYFQTAEMVDRRLPAVAADLTLYLGDRTLVVPATDIAVKSCTQAAHFDHVPVLILSAKDPELLKGADLKGKAVVTPDSDWDKLSGDARTAGYRKMRAFNQTVASSGAALAITIVANKQMPGPPRLLFVEEAAAAGAPLLAVRSQDLAKRMVAGATLTVDIPAPIDNKIAVKNVIGILRGSDPVLSQTAVLLTAHYDHIGTVETAGQMSMHSPGDSPDRIYNGANDDGSGTVSVIEIGRALAKIQPRPKRSVVFITFFGEERGELGSEFYGKHPVFPISKTVADVNLEQVGRTDSTVGPQLNDASVTGFDYSDVTGFLSRAGERVGIKVYRDAEASDAYFTRSDNDALARQGVPAHTLCVAFDFPDYHGVGDEWQKINYENMAKVDRMVLLALLNIANSEKAPEWNASNPKTEHFRAAKAASMKGPD